MDPDVKKRAIDHVQVALEYCYMDYQRWRKELEFTRQELDIVNHQIEDMVVVLSDTEFLTDLKHYQNLFIRKRELVDNLLHKVELDTKETARLAEDPYTLAGYFDMQKHLTLGNEMLLFSRLYIDLWYSFNKFLRRVFRENEAEDKRTTIQNSTKSSCSALMLLPNSQFLLT